MKPNSELIHSGAYSREGAVDRTKYPYVPWEGSLEQAIEEFHKTAEAYEKFSVSFREVLKEFEAAIRPWIEVMKELDAKVQQTLNI